MDALIERHIAAETAGELDAAVAVYTDDVEHDVVGAPHGPLQGVAAARGFYDHLISNIATGTMTRTRTWYGADFCVVEHQWTGRVPGSFLGIPGNGKAIEFRMLHVFEFRDGLICRENVWIDVPAVRRQLAPEPAAAAVAR